MPETQINPEIAMLLHRPQGATERELARVDDKWIKQTEFFMLYYGLKKFRDEKGELRFGFERKENVNVESKS